MAKNNNYEDLDYIDPDEDREEEFLQEEEYDDGPENIQEAFKNVNEKAKKAIGLDGRENYDSTSEHIANHVAYNGVWGVARGIFISAVALIAEIAHVFVNNLMGGHAHLNVRRALAEANGIETLKEDRKKDTVEERPKTKEKDDNEKAGLEKETQTKDETVKETGPKQESPSYDINSKIFQHAQKNMESPESTDMTIDVCLNSNSVWKVFKELGVQPVNTYESKKIHLFSEKTEMDMKHILCMSKEDFLKGNAGSLAAALYEYHSPDHTMESKMSAALQAVIAQAKIQAEINADILSECNKDSKVKLSEIYFQTEQLDTAHMYLEMSNDLKYTKLFYQDKEVGTVNLNEPIQKQLDCLLKQTMEHHKQLPLRLYTLHHEGNTLSFAKKGTDLVTIRCGKNFDSIKIHEEKDMKKLSQFLQNQYGFSETKGNASAMVIAMNAFPMLQKSVDEFGYELNPFTEEKKRTGDVFINRDSDAEHNISTYGVELIDGKVKENISAIVSQESCNKQKTDIDAMVSKVEQCFEIEKKENTLDDMVLPMEVSSKKPILENPDWDNGYKAFQILKERSVLDNLDISKIKFREEQIHSHEKSKQEREHEPNKAVSFKEQDSSVFEDVELNEEELAAYRESEMMQQIPFEVPECDELEL